MTNLAKIKFLFTVMQHYCAQIIAVRSKGAFKAFYYVKIKRLYFIFNNKLLYLNLALKV